jgi:hypothetical protein
VAATTTTGMTVQYNCFHNGFTPTCIDDFAYIHIVYIAAFLNRFGWTLTIKEYRTSGKLMLIPFDQKQVYSGSILVMQ